MPDTRPSGGHAPPLHFNPQDYSKEGRSEAFKHFSTFFDAIEKLNEVIDKICEAIAIEVHDAIIDKLIELAKAVSAAKEAHQSLTQLSLHQTKSDSHPTTATFPEAEVKKVRKGVQAELKAIMVNSVAPGLESVSHKAVTTSSATTTTTSFAAKAEGGPNPSLEPAPTAENRASVNTSAIKRRGNATTHDAAMEPDRKRSRTEAEVEENMLFEVLGADEEWIVKNCYGYGKKDFTTSKPFGADATERAHLVAKAEQ
ncbi:hypothetical protein PG996_004909 [Apiospora saccharicola]|uniref:Uncharacterized protein n=1 Tax=Apiospora saccharicola TaxID=335842 RepID=A0ABR1VJZ7_9PEZI